MPQAQLATLRDRHNLFKEIVLRYAEGPHFKMGRPTHYSADLPDDKLTEILWCDWGDRRMLDHVEDSYPLVTIEFDPRNDSYGVNVCNWPSNGDGSSASYIELKHIFEDYDFFFDRYWPRRKAMLNLVNVRQQRMFGEGYMGAERWLKIAPIEETLKDGKIVDKTRFKWVYHDDGSDFDPSIFDSVINGETRCVCGHIRLNITDD